MSGSVALFEVNGAIDRAAAKRAYARDRRVQVRDFLDEGSARTILKVLRDETPWGLAWRDQQGAHGLRRAEIERMPEPERQGIGDRVTETMRGGQYTFLYAYYPILDAYLQRWGESEALALLLEHINSEPFLELVREVTGHPGLIKADAQATLYAPGHFLSVHDDTHVAEGWQVAYVMNFCDGEWRPDWGGHLLFHDDRGEVIGGFAPRFNSLNLFAVPQRHSVSYVPAFAPVGRFAISGWLRDR